MGEILSNDGAGPTGSRRSRGGESPHRPAADGCDGQLSGAQWRQQSFAVRLFGQIHLPQERLVTGIAFETL